MHSVQNSDKKEFLMYISVSIVQKTWMVTIFKKEKGLQIHNINQDIIFSSSMLLLMKIC